MPADPRVLGYLLMDPQQRYWFDPVAWLWVSISYTENGAEVADFLPPPQHVHPDPATARKAAAPLIEAGVDVRPVRVRIPC